MGGSQLLSLEEARARLGIGRTLLYAVLSNGQLPSVRIGERRLIAVRDLEAFIERRREVRDAVSA
jgi:excisionase family DNA binding protein